MRTETLTIHKPVSPSIGAMQESTPAQMASSDFAAALAQANLQSSTSVSDPLSSLTSSLGLDSTLPGLTANTSTPSLLAAYASIDASLGGSGGSSTSQSSFFGGLNTTDMSALLSSSPSTLMAYVGAAMGIASPIENANSTNTAVAANATGGGLLASTATQRAAYASAVAQAPSPVSSPATSGTDTTWIHSLINQLAPEYGLNPHVVSAVVNQESGFSANAHSSAGAMGLMQLMPDTASSLGVTDPYDPVQNLRGGMSYLSSLLSRYHGQLPLALAAYNAGPQAVTNFGGVPPFPETQNYVANIMQAIAK